MYLLLSAPDMIMIIEGIMALAMCVKVQYPVCHMEMGKGFRQC